MFLERGAYGNNGATQAFSSALDASDGAEPFIRQRRLPQIRLRF